MKQPIKTILYCLPVMLVMLLTVFITAPASAAAQLKTPVLKAPVNTVSGVKVSWSKVSGAAKYRVFVKTGSSSWKKLADTASASYQHKAAQSGVTYTYTVCCISKDGKQNTSGYNRTGKKITHVKAPAIASFTNTEKGPRLSWSACKGAAKYRVYIKTSKSWKTLATTANTYYLHTAARNNTAYTYKIQCLNKSGKIISAAGTARKNNYRFAKYTNAQFAAAVYTAIGKETAAPSSPTAILTRKSAAAILCTALSYSYRSLVSLTDSSDPYLLTLASYGYFVPDSGNRISPSRWVTVDEYEAIIADVNRYALYRGKKIIAFGDSIMVGYGNRSYGYGRLFAEKYGMSYNIYAKCGATFSTADNGHKHILDQVKNAKSANAKGDIILINGGTNDAYMVARKQGGETYNANQPAKSNFAKGFEATLKLIGQYWNNTPVVYIRDHNMVHCTDKLERQIGEYGVKIAQKYKALVIDAYTSGILNTEKAAVRNRYTMYKASVKGGDSIHPNGLGYAAYYLPLLAEQIIFSPTVTELTNTASGVRISWSSVGDAPRYRVFIKTGSGWEKLADTAEKQYLHTGVTSGAKYSYTVRCISADGKQFTSSCNTTGKTITYIKPPTLSLSNTADGVRLDWNKSSGAVKFRVMLHNGTAWQKLTDTAETSYIYHQTASGESYTFAVRCITANGNAFTSAASASQTITFIKAPRITGVTDETDGAKITWDACSGAAQYRVLIKTGSDWQTLVDTDKTVCTHDADHDVSYTYAVCCLDADGSVISAYDPAGYTHRYSIPAALDTPVIEGFENTEAGLLLRWKAVAGAVRYRVLIKNNDRWTYLGETNETSYLSTNITNGETITCTVCCVSEDSVAYTSAYNSVGCTTTYYGAPELRLTNASDGILLEWDGCESAPYCRLFVRKGTKWTKLADTLENSYLYTPEDPDTDYCFTACFTDANGSPLGAYSETGFSLHYNPDPDNTVYTTGEFAYDVYRTLGADTVTPASPKAALNRRNSAEILCKALAYQNHTKGISLLDTDSSALKTAVFFGCFYPDENDRIYPDTFLSHEEYDAMLTEVERYTRLKGKTALAFGDSIMYGYGNYGYGSCRIISEKYGMTFINYSYCGATFGTCSNGRVHIPDRIKKAYTSGYKADIIFLNGGTNDLTLIRKGETPDTFDPKKPQNSTYVQGFEYAMTLIRNYWGNTPVLYTRNHNMVVSTEEMEKQLGEYGLRIAEKYGARIVDIYTDTDLDTEIPEMRDRYTMYRSDLTRSDGIHPNWLGYTSYYLPLETEAILSILTP